MMIRATTLIPLIILFAATPALAIDGKYLGTWTSEPGNCNLDSLGPFRITKKGIDGREVSCQTKRARQDGAGWSVQMSCLTEDKPKNTSVLWQILPNGHLKEVSKGKSTDYVRCP